jgi:hypothetical protein
MTLSVQSIRFAASVAACALSAQFVVVFTRMSYLRLSFEHPDHHLTHFNSFMTQHPYIGWMFPTVLAVLGVAAHRCRCGREAVVEAVTQVGWLLAIGWAFVSVLSWQIQYFPVLSAGEWRL